LLWKKQGRIEPIALTFAVLSYLSFQVAFTH